MSAAERRKAAYALRRRLGLCVRCGAAACPGRSLCGACSVRASARAAARRTALLARRTCPCCGRRRVEEDRTLCGPCAMRRRTPAGRATGPGRRRFAPAQEERRERAMLSLLEGEA